MAIIDDDAQEVRVTDSASGGQKGQKLARYDLLPVDALEEVAKLYGVGASTKYAERNWERGYDWSLSYASLQRHANAFWKGESVDAETRRHHLAAVVFHAFALMTFEAHGLGNDNRPVVAAEERAEESADGLVVGTMGVTTGEWAYEIEPGTLVLYAGGNVAWVPEEAFIHSWVAGDLECWNGRVALAFWVDEVNWRVGSRVADTPVAVSKGHGT